MKHYWKDVPRLGNVVVSRHAQKRALDEDISEALFAEVLLEGKDTPDGQDTILRESMGIRLVIITPTPFRGAKLVKTLFRVKPSLLIR